MWSVRVDAVLTYVYARVSHALLTVQNTNSLKTESESKDSLPLVASFFCVWIKIYALFITNLQTSKTLGRTEPDLRALRYKRLLSPEAHNIVLSALHYEVPNPELQTPHFF